MRQPNAGTSAPTRVKVKAHTRAAPTASQVNAATNPRPIQSKPAKPTRPAKPFRPVQTPDSRDNNRTARHPNVSHVSPDAQDVAGRSQAQHAYDEDYAQGVQEAARGKNPTLAKELGLHPKPVKAKVKAGHGPGHVLGSITPGALVHAIGNVDAGGSMPVFSGIAKVAGRSIKDAEELAVTTPSSVAHLASTAVHHPEKVPGELLAPYKQLAEHPIKSLSEHPLQTALMVAPAVRMPGRVLGKGLRVAGKQSLERTAGELPGTTLKVARTGSRDAAARAVQSHADRKTPAPTATVKDVQRRVDEAFGAQQKHRERVTAHIMRDAHHEAKMLPKAQREAHIENAREAARGAAMEQAHRAYVREFGAPHQVTPAGLIAKPKNATEGAFHATREDAQKVADRLNHKPVMVTRGGFTRGEKALPLAHQQVPLTFTPHKAGDKYGVIPDLVSKRIVQHEKVGTSLAPGAKVLRISRGSFTRAVLPYRPTWLTGQAVEGVIRNTVHGAGPTSYLRARKVVSAMERQKVGSGKALLDRAVPSGKIGKVYKETADLEHMGHTLASEFPDNPVAHALTSLGKTPGVKQVRQLHHAVSSAVFTHLNGRYLEAVPQTAMLGKALKNSPLMERSIVGLSDKAIDDAAKGLQATHAQVQLARAVQRAYGKYSNFGPALRETILHWTPFIPWLVNSGRFLADVLPRDHPITTALLADVTAAEDQWRKAHDLSMRKPNHVPFYMMGGAPHNGSMLEVAHYTPFGAAQDPTGGLAGLVLPQFSSAYGAIQYGVDWKGKPLMHGGSHGVPYTAPEKWLYALTQLGQAMVPLSSQAAAVAGAKDKGKALRKQFRLMASVSPKQGGNVQPLSNAPAASGRVQAVRVKPVAAARGQRVQAVRVKPVRVP